MGLGFRVGGGGTGALLSFHGFYSPFGLQQVSLGPGMTFSQSSSGGWILGLLSCKPLMRVARVSFYWGLERLRSLCSSHEAFLFRV